MTELGLSDPFLISVGVAAGLVAGLVKGFTGFGGTAILILVLTQFFSPLSVLPKIVLVDVLAQALLLPARRQNIDWPFVGLLSAATIIALPLGVVALLEIDANLLKRVIAGVVGICACLMLAGWRYGRTATAPVTIAVGVSFGVICGATFIALPIFMFILASPALAHAARASCIAWGLSMSVAMGVILAYTDVLHLEDVWQSGILAAAYLAGSFSGARVFKGADEKIFRRVVVSLLLALSVIGVAI